jgi:hypothetical protein
MNQVEEMQGKIAALSGRIERLEKVNEAQLKTINGLTAAFGPDSTAAQMIAQEMGFAVEVLVIADRRRERWALARRLKEKGWSLARIARALGCCERSVERWTS